MFYDSLGPQTSRRTSRNLFDKPTGVDLLECTVITTELRSNGEHRIVDSGRTENMTTDSRDIRAHAQAQGPLDNPGERADDLRESDVAVAVSRWILVPARWPVRNF